MYSERVRRQPAEPVRELPAHQPGISGPGHGVLTSEHACAGNQQSLYVSYLHISQAYLDLAMGF